MARSHPPSLARHVESALLRECQLKAGDKILLGVSGGPDSLALCHVLARLQKKLSFELAVLSCDHGLRPEAAQEVLLVRDFCERQNVQFFCKDLALSSGGNLQARARAARYEALFSVADEQLGERSLVATAHHKDDRAETVLLRLLRGTSVEGLGVLPARKERLIRPMIRSSKQDVQLHIEREGLSPVLDPSNLDKRFLRVRVRTELLPLLKELSPGIVDHLAGLSDEALELPEPLGLNREQRSQLRRALRDPGILVNLLLPGGLRVERVAKKGTLGRNRPDF